MPHMTSGRRLGTGSNFAAIRERDWRITLNILPVLRRRPLPSSSLAISDLKLAIPLPSLILSSQPDKCIFNAI